MSFESRLKRLQFRIPVDPVQRYFEVPDCVEKKTKTHPTTTQSKSARKE